MNNALRLEGIKKTSISRLDDRIRRNCIIFCWDILFFPNLIIMADMDLRISRALLCT